jgi:hypothetical protein
MSMVLLTQTPDVARLVTACSSRASAADLAHEASKLAARVTDTAPCWL